MSKLLIPDNPLQVLPKLAVAIGLNEAMVLQQVHYWLERSGFCDRAGIQWVYNTVEQWQQQFPFWSADTVRRTLASLRESGLLVAEALAENKFDKTMFYRIDYGALGVIEDVILATSNDGVAPAPARAKAKADKKTETTSETTTENLPAVAGRRKRTAVDKSEEETATQAACRQTWGAYAGAYAERYGAPPIRNAKVNSQVKQLVARLGFDEAPQVAIFYLGINDQFVVRRMHDLGLLVNQAEGYRTQWATGRQMTNTRARQVDQSQANYSAADEALRIAMAKRGAVDAQ